MTWKPAESLLPPIPSGPTHPLADRDWTKAPCSRCGVELWNADGFDESQSCWYCEGPLCVECWEEFSECGHAEADAANEYARSVPQPPGHPAHRRTT